MIQAIHTSYEGQRFRSRLEARWAMYMTTLNIPWQYEKEAFDLDGLTYVPDFWLPSHRAWLETKGDLISDQTGLVILDKCKRLAILSAYPVILAFNDPLDQRCAVFGIKGGFYPNSFFTTCLICGALGIRVRTGSFTKFLCPNGKEHNPATVKAVSEARRASFDAATEARKHSFGISRKGV
jgi:hypothetical protein